MEYMSLPLRIEVAPAGTASETVEQEIIVVNRASRFNLLMQLLPNSTGPVLVFTRTKHNAKDIAKKLRDNKITSAEIHSNRSLGQRRQALDGFKTGRYKVLVATDIAARGIDVKNIELVINYDLPEQKEDYVHRIGRTGRAGTKGKAISFAMPDQRRDIIAIEKLINKSIPKKSHENAEMTEFKYPARHSFGGHRGYRGGYRGNNHRGQTGNKNQTNRPEGNKPRHSHSFHGSSSRKSFGGHKRFGK
jgi:ATP-dependent RNA helicase RhlE